MWTMQVCTIVSGQIASIASGKPFRPSTQQTSTSSIAAVLQLGQDRQPLLGALAFRDPKAEDVLDAEVVDPDREVGVVVLHAALVADLDHERVHPDDRIEPLERPALPLRDVLEHRVGDAADQIPADLDAVQVAQLRLDLPRRHPAAHTAR